LYGEKKGDPQQNDDFVPAEEINPKMQKVKTAPKCLKPKHQQQKKETALPKYFTSKVVGDPVDNDETHLNPMSVDIDIVNFAINNELRECNKYRLEHINVEET